MLKSLKSFFSDMVCHFNYIGNRFHRIVVRKKVCYTTEEIDHNQIVKHYLMNSFANIPKTLPPKFDSIADRLMENISITHTDSNHDQQQLFLLPLRKVTPENPNDDYQNKEVFDQLKQLDRLLKKIITEYSTSNYHNTSFLREVVNNICLDLNVMLTNLDLKIMMETDMQNKL